MLEHSPIRISGVTPVTGITVMFLVVIYLIHVLTGDFKPEHHTVRPQHGFEPSKWYRFLTYPLVHKNLLYLFVSVLGLLVIGVRLEKKLGTMLFLYTQAICWIGSVITFAIFGTVLYFISDYTDWLELKNTGFAPVLFCYAVIDSYIGKRDTFRIILPWLLSPIIPMLFHRVSLLSVLAGCSFGFLMTRGRLGKLMLPNRDSLLRAQESATSVLLASSWSSFVPVWNESTTPPFDQAAEGSMCSDTHRGASYESIRLIPMSSKESSQGLATESRDNLASAV